MRFLIDRCAGRRLTDWLRQQGHDATYSPELGPDCGDAALLDKALQDGRVLVTIDTDFAQLVFVQGAPHAGIIRLPDVRAETRIELMKRVLAQYAEQLGPSTIITVRGNRIRVSSAP